MRPPGLRVACCSNTRLKLQHMRASCSMCNGGYKQNSSSSPTSPQHLAATTEHRQTLPPYSCHLPYYNITRLHPSFGCRIIGVAGSPCHSYHLDLWHLYTDPHSISAGSTCRQCSGGKILTCTSNKNRKDPSLYSVSC